MKMKQLKYGDIDIIIKNNKNKVAHPLCQGKETLEHQS